MEEDAKCSSNENVDHLHLDIAKAKKEREKLLQDHIAAEKEETPNSLLSDSIILNACSQINSLLQQNLFSPIDCINYQRSCTMLNIVQLSHTISILLEKRNSETEFAKKENAALQAQLDKALAENNYITFKCRMQADKEKDKLIDYKLNKAALRSERKVNELESTIRTLKNKLSIKEKEMEAFKSQADNKDKAKKPGSLILNAKLEEKQFTIQRLERDLDKAQRQNQSLEEIIHNLQNSAFLDSKYREAQDEIVNI